MGSRFRVLSARIGRFDRSGAGRRVWGSGFRVLFSSSVGVEFDDRWIVGRRPSSGDPNASSATRTGGRTAIARGLIRALSDSSLHLCELQPAARTAGYPSRGPPDHRRRSAVRSCARTRASSAISPAKRRSPPNADRDERRVRPLRYGGTRSITVTRRSIDGIASWHPDRKAHEIYSPTHYHRGPGIIDRIGTAIGTAVRIRARRTFARGGPRRRSPTAGRPAR